MADNGHEVIFWSTEYSLLNLEELADAVKLHPELIKKLVNYGLIEPVTATDAEPMFHISSIERLRRIMRLRRDLGVNLAGIAVILDMRERMEELQKEVERLRRSFGVED